MMNEINKPVFPIGDLRVHLVADETAYFAQGLELDYAAQGATLNEVQSYFLRGLNATLRLHLDKYGKIKIDPASKKCWNNWRKAILKTPDFRAYRHSSHLEYPGERLYDILPFEYVCFYWTT